MSKELIVYSAAVCPFAQRTLIVLNEKKLAYKLIEIDLANKPKDFLEISPYGKVPVLKDNDMYIYESMVINEYLEEKYPQPALLPQDYYIKAQIRIWSNYVNSEFVPVYYKLLISQDKSIYPQLKEALIKALYYIEKGITKCSEGPFWFGGNLTLADANNYPFFERFIANEYYRDVHIPQDCYRLRAWIKTMREQASVIKTANPPEFYIMRYAKYADASGLTPGAKQIIDDLWL